MGREEISRGTTQIHPAPSASRKCLHLSGAGCS